MSVHDQDHLDRLRPRRSPWSKGAAVAAALAVVVGLTAQATPAALARTQGPVIQADPDSVAFTLEGCRNDGTITLPIGGVFVCPDGAYTSGNLGKGWAELDLVPYRLTAKAGNSAPADQTFTIAYATFANPKPLPTVNGGTNIIVAALTIMQGTNVQAIRDIGAALDAYNNSGDNTTIQIPGSLTIGKADPNAARGGANLPAGDC